MSDITTRLLAALDAEQQIAEAASPGEWQAVNDPTYKVGYDPGPSPRDENGFSDEWMGRVSPGDCGTVNPWDARHIAYQHPTRTLRRVAALRRIVERHEGKTWCNGCGHHTYPCPDLLDLADALGVEP